MSVSKLSLSLLICAVAATSSGSFAAESKAPESEKQPAAKSVLDKKQAGFYRMKIGSVDVVTLSDGTCTLPVDKLTVNDKPGELERLLTFSYEVPPVSIGINAYLVHLGDRWILVDSGASNLLGPTAGKLPDALHNAGVKPEDITDIFVTHLHGDHVGGVTSNGKKVFPNATLHINKNESDFWLSKDQEAKSPEFMKQFFKPAQDSVKPYAETQKLETFTDAVTFFPGFKSRTAYGHTPGHTFYELEDGGQKLVFVGDMIHVPSAQFDDPKIAMKFDCDSPLAVNVREALFADAAKNGYQIAGGHLPFPGCGHVRKDGDHYRWIPVTYINDAVE